MKNSILKVFALYGLYGVFSFGLGQRAWSQSGSDSLIVGSHEVNSTDGSLVSFSASSNSFESKITQSLQQPKVLDISKDQSEILMSTSTGAGILKYSYSTSSSSSFAASATVEGMTRDHCGNVFIAERTNNRIRVLSPSGADIYTINLIANSLPRNIIFDSSGKLHVAATGQNYIPTYDLTYSGCQVTNATTSSSTVVASCGPAGLAYDSAGNLYVSCTANGNIKKISPTGVLLGNFATTPTVSGSALGNRGLVWHKDAGGNDYLYVTNMIHNLVYKIGVGGGSPVSSFGAGQLTSPQSIVVKRAVPLVTPSVTPIFDKDSPSINLRIAGNPNQTVQILASSDLSTWTPLSTVQLDATGDYLYSDWQARQLYPKRFYKLSYNPYEGRY